MARYSSVGASIKNRFRFSSKVRASEIISILGILGLMGCQSAPRGKSEKEPLPGVVTLRTLAPDPAAEDLNALASDLGLNASDFGYILFDPETKKVLEEKNSKKTFVPSSLNKVIPTYAALQILGKNFKYKTELYYKGNIKNKVLTGDLYLKGGGDPFLTISDLLNIVGQLKKRGVNKVSGHFYYDESAYVAKEGILLDRDTQASYNAGLSALSSEFNQAVVSWQTTGDPTVLDVSVLPALSQLQTGLSTEAESDSSLLYQASESTSAGPTEKWMIHPSTHKDGTKRIPIKHPGFATASLFRNFAEMQGVLLPTPESRKTESDAKELFVYRSLPLWELVGKGLEYSNNLMSELFLLGSAVGLGDQNPSIESSAKKVQEWIRKKLSKTDWEGFVLNNGSGLGSINRVSPAQVAAVLEGANRWEEEGHSFLSLLPALGWKGTLEKRQKNSQMAFRVWAKTGTQKYSSALGGFLFTSSGKKLIFAVLSTDFANRKKVDTFSDSLPKQLEEGAHQWSEAARKFEDSLLVRWVQKY